MHIFHLGIRECVSRGESRGIRNEVSTDVEVRLILMPSHQLRSFRRVLSGSQPQQQDVIRCSLDQLHPVLFHLLSRRLHRSPLRHGLLQARDALWNPPLRLLSDDDFSFHRVLPTHSGSRIGLRYCLWHHLLTRGRGASALVLCEERAGLWYRSCWKLHRRRYLSHHDAAADPYDWLSMDDEGGESERTRSIQSVVEFG